jgi:hypothetical protein
LSACSALVANSVDLDLHVEAGVARHRLHHLARPARRWVVGVTSVKLGLVTPASFSSALAFDVALGHRQALA